MLEGCSVGCQRRMENLSFKIDGNSELSGSSELSKIVQAILAAMPWQLAVTAGFDSLYVCSL